MTFTIYLILAVLLAALPFFYRLNPVLNYLSNLIVMPYTLIHEICHSLTTLLTFGRVGGIQLFANSSGLAFSSTGSSLSRFLTTFAGYTGSSLISVLFTYWIAHDSPNYVFYTYMAFSLLTFLWIRNVYGFLYVGLFNALAIYLLYTKNELVIEHVAMYLTTILLVQAVVFSFTILRLAKRDKQQAGDATALAKQTKIPALFWGLCFFAFSLACFSFALTRVLYNFGI